MVGVLSQFYNTKPYGNGTQNDHLIEYSSKLFHPQKRTANIHQAGSPPSTNIRDYDSNRPRDDRNDFDIVRANRQEFVRQRQVSQERYRNPGRDTDRGYEYRPQRNASVGNLSTVQLPPIRQQSPYRSRNDDLQRYPQTSRLDYSGMGGSVNEVLPPIQDPMNRSVALPLSMLLNPAENGAAEPEENNPAEEEYDEEEAEKDYQIRLSLERQNYMLEKLAQKLEDTDKKRRKIKLKQQNLRNAEIMARQKSRQGPLSHHQPLIHPMMMAPRQTSESKGEFTEKEVARKLQELEKELEMKNLIAQQKEKIERLEMQRMMQKPDESEDDEDTAAALLLQTQMQQQESNMMQMMMLASALKNNNNNSQNPPWPSAWGPSQMFPGRQTVPMPMPMPYPTTTFPMPGAMPSGGMYAVPLSHSLLPLGGSMVGNPMMGGGGYF